MQSYQKKMRNNLAEVHLSTKNLSEMLDESNLNLGDFSTLRRVSIRSDFYHPYDPSSASSRPDQKL